MRNMSLKAACLTVACVAAAFMAAPAVVAQHDHSGEGGADPASSYVEIVGLEISTLSDQDVAELLAGAGRGFALPAEMNGLPDEQNAAYSRLRGSVIMDGAANDPCANVPQGHEPEMLRRHNDCDG